MHLQFTRSARDDLDDLKDLLQAISPNGYNRVVQRLTAVIENLLSYPNSGRRTAHSHIRELIEPRYGFVIPYLVKGDTVFILRVFSAKRYPLNYDEAIDPSQL